MKEHTEFVQVFRDNKNFRNALCHFLDTSVIRPYSDDKEMLEFAIRLQRMHELAYVNKLEEKLAQKEKKASVVLENKKKEDQFMPKFNIIPKKEMTKVPTAKNNIPAAVSEQDESHKRKLKNPKESDTKLSSTDDNNAKKTKLVDYPSSEDELEETKQREIEKDTEKDQSIQSGPKMK